MTKIDIISGFLGAGKTTLIKKLLNDALKGEQVVLIENEFGEIGIDGGFLKDAGIEIREMNQGCICCSLVGNFEKSLQEVVETYKPDRIIIEPSGVGKLSDVRKAVEDAKDAKVHESPYVKRRLPEDSYRMGIITDPQQVGGLPKYKGEPYKDSDGDGIPDEWEIAHGLDPHDPSDAYIIREDGYMNVEYYSFSIIKKVKSEK